MQVSIYAGNIKRQIERYIYIYVLYINETISASILIPVNNIPITFFSNPILVYN